MSSGTSDCLMFQIGFLDSIGNSWFAVTMSSPCPIALPAEHKDCTQLCLLIDQDMAAWSAGLCHCYTEPGDHLRAAPNVFIPVPPSWTRVSDGELRVRGAP